MSQLRTLADDLGVDERTLRRAAGLGTLRAERPSPRKLKIAPGEVGYLRRRWPLLAALRGALRTEPNVAFALLFGSAARGDDGADSDLDLIVALRDPSLDGMVELQDRLERRLGREVDLLSVEAASSNDLLISMAVEDGPGPGRPDRSLARPQVRTGRPAAARRPHLEARAPTDARGDRRIPRVTDGEDKKPRPTDLRRWKKEVVDGLASLPREHEALEYAMAEFGTSFDLAELKRALAPRADIALYNRVQALERAVTRVQNILADLAIAGAKLGGLPLPATNSGPADRSFEALKDGGVISAALSRRLRNAQRVRNLIEHDYDKVSAGQLHKVAEEVRGVSLEFVRPFRDWVGPKL